MDCPFWPYCQTVIKRDLSHWKKSRTLHAIAFLLIALLLTLLEERKVAAIFSSASIISVLRLCCEIFADRVLGFSIFKEGE